MKRRTARISPDGLVTVRADRPVVRERDARERRQVVNGHEPLGVVALAAVRDRTATLVILMGVSMLSEITDQAVTAGADVATPVAVVESGSTQHQRVTRATLGTLVRRAADAGIRAPAVVVVGDVAAEGLLVPDATTPLPGLTVLVPEPAL